MHSPEGEGEYEEEGMVGMSEDEVVPAEGLDGDVPEGEDIDLEGAEGGEGEGEGEGEVESMGEGEGVGEIAGAGAAAGVGADAGGAQSEGKGKGKAKAQVSDTVISSSWVLLARPTANGLEHLDADAGADAGADPMQARRRGKGRAAEKKRAAGATPAKVQRREADLYESEIVARWNAGEWVTRLYRRTGALHCFSPLWETCL
jgi:hypothetical protein